MALLLDAAADTKTLSFCTYECPFMGVAIVTTGGCPLTTIKVLVAYVMFPVLSVAAMTSVDVPDGRLAIGNGWVGSTTVPSSR